MPYSPCFRRMACCNSCAWKPRTKGHSWHRSIYMWERYLHYRGQEIFGQLGKKRTRKWSTFKDCHRMDRCSLRRSYFVIRSPCGTHKYANGSRRARKSKKWSPLASGGPEYPQIQPKAGLFGPESQRTSFVVVFQTSFWTHWHFLLKKIREIMLLIDISPPGRDKRTFLQMLYDPGNLIWP